MKKTEWLRPKELARVTRRDLARIEEELEAGVVAGRFERRKRTYPKGGKAARASEVYEYRHVRGWAL